MHTRAIAREPFWYDEMVDGTGDDVTWTPGLGCRPASFEW